MSTQPSTSRESRAIEAWACLLRGHAAARRKLSAELHGAHRLTVNDYEALLLLSRSKEKVMRRVDLAEALQLTASGVTRLLDGLEEHGLVEKVTCSTDARVTYARLTETGRQKLKKASSSHIVGVRALFEERYTTRELATLAELLGRLPGASDDAGVSSA
jgi:DNA-binding MarR family transcriptional regulator